ncbi:glycosyltransferase involved in cell wall biosynthesis [Desulfobotulus alkaliphilus]|uniref:Glycosyltransferase involved in cell wall biosynthesis n=1 Tax=Desulfobotulus alkaliphilus TaxID=622671 RepID=A0A562RMM5_9BACT|nr:glycosyltransferase family 4 protein [Desulfobotulus alkaliphilus]TWI70301.1 glycosyltransferase involved in cell wall biosynthesis [Desulfobotulus alkaliphilus]
MSEKTNQPLRICMISYRSNPHSGGQGVYIRNLAKALCELGHEVDVLAGPPDPLLEGAARLIPVETLDLYNPEALFRTPRLDELKDPVNLMEWIGTSTMGYPEPFTFGFRAVRHLKDQLHKYDIIHDNQSLSYGIEKLSRKIPTVATIHHPMTVDRRLAVRSVRAPWKKFKHLRWYSFIGMQKRVSRKLPKIITVSEFSKKDIAREYAIDPSRFSVVPNGISTELFHPMPAIPREPGRLIVTNSADMPLKGLYHLLEALHRVSLTHSVRLTVIGKAKEKGGIEKLIKKLNIAHLIDFTGRIDHHQFVREYAKASIAVVPSLYEGFGLPVGEAMATATPVISTTGGALPEVAGDAALLVPPGNSNALAKAICSLLDDPEKRKQLGAAGYNRVHEHFTWKNAAEKTVETYREVIRDYR